MALSESIDLVLVGKTGNGKSATGNSILGIKAFQENTSSSPSVSREPVVHSSLLGNKPVRVVDGLDLGVREISIFDRQLDKAIRLLKNGFSALLIVVRSDVPFSKEEARGLEVLKDRLGQNIIRDFGICAVTYGDNFQLEVREKKVANFEDWYKTQTGDLRKLFEECRFRCVLFNNMAVERASRDNLNRFVLELSEENLRQGYRRKFEMLTATNIDKPWVRTHRANLPSVHDGNRKVVEELTQQYQTQKSQLHSGAVSSKEPRFDTLAISSKEPRFDTGAVFSKEPRFFTGAVSSKERRFDTIAISSKEPRFDTSAIFSKEPRFDTGAVSSKEPRFDTSAIFSKEPRFDTGAVSSKEPRFDTGAASSKEPRLDTDNLEAESEQFSKIIESRLAEIIRLRNKEIQELIEETQSCAEKIRAQAKLPSSQRFLTRFDKLNGSLRSLLQEIPLNAEQSPERVVQILESDELISGGAEQISGRDEQISRKDDQISRRDEQNTIKKVQVARPGEKQKSTSVPTNIPSISSCNKATLDQRDNIQKIKMREPSDIDLLLIGKTGNGKSATGNSILRRKAFKSISSSSSVTKEVAYEVSDFQGRIIKVVDGPGVGDTRMDNEKAVNLVLKAIEYAIAANPRGYHAFLLVTRFGGRFTAEDQDTIAFLKNLFGETFVRSYCILVLTCGDNFEVESEDTGVSFEDWCKEQEGVFAELMKECENRIILFDNVTKDERKKCDQIEKLIKIVDNLRFQGYRYTDENFSNAKAARERLMIEAKKPMIQEETMNETSLIIQKIQELQLQDDLNMKIQLLEDLQTRAENLCQSISSQDLGTGALHDLCETAKSVQRTVRDEIKFCEGMLKERERIKTQEEETRRVFEEQMRKQKEDFERQTKEMQLKEEERRKFDKEQERARYEAEEKRRREREEQERRLRQEFQEEQMRQKKRIDELEQLYMEAKAKNDEGFFDKLVKVVSWLTRKGIGYAS